ncbi:hypothetical protein Tco_1020533 [Tanacetum coccineum]
MLTAIAGRRWVVRHGFCLAVYNCARSVECQSALGKVILMAINRGIQQGLEAGVVHGKAGRSLTQIEAYDPAVEGKYVIAISKFKGVSFPLLDELESLKDSPLALIMSALTLKYGQGNKDTPPEFSRFQPSLDQSAERRGLCSPSGFTLGGASGSVTLPGSSLGVGDYRVSTLVLADDGGSANQPSATQSHDDLFDTSVLDKPGDV